jgi:hypothetical protein
MTVAYQGISLIHAPPFSPLMLLYNLLQIKSAAKHEKAVVLQLG